MAGPSHGSSQWGSDFKKNFKASEQSESSKESMSDDGLSSKDSYESDDCIKDSNESVDSVLLALVSERNWVAVYESLSDTLKAEAEPGQPPLPHRHPWLYLILYKEHIIDLMLQNKEADAHKFYTENVHHLTDFANSGFAVSSHVQNIVREMFNITKNRIEYEPTQNKKMRDRVDFYLRLYCSEAVGHNAQPGTTKSHLWQFVIRVHKSKPNQLNPSFRCLACGITFTNCTISKYREHVTEEKNKGKKRKKFPMCKMITMNMKLRYSLGEREQKNPHSSKFAQSNDNAQCPQQALAREEIVPTKKMSKGRGISKETGEKNAEGEAPELLIHQALGGKRKRTDELLEIDMQEKKRHPIVKGSNDQCQEGSALAHLVTGVRSNVAGFNELFGDKRYTLAVRSDLDVARDMLCTMTGIKAENDLVSRAELLDEGTSHDLVSVACDTVDKANTEGSIAHEVRTIPSNTEEEKVEEGIDIHDLATLVRQSVSFLFRFYKKEKFTKEVQRELLEAKILLSRMISCQKK